jgi:hypothetical protein
MELEDLKERTILTPTNDVADTINGDIVSLIPEDEKQYLSCDTVVKALNTHDSYDLLYPAKFFIESKQFPTT